MKKFKTTIEIPQDALQIINDAVQKEVSKAVKQFKVKDRYEKELCAKFEHTISKALTDGSFNRILATYMVNIINKDKLIKETAKCLAEKIKEEL